MVGFPLDDSGAHSVGKACRRQRSSHLWSSQEVSHCRRWISCQISNHDDPPCTIRHRHRLPLRCHWTSVTEHPSSRMSVGPAHVCGTHAGTHASYASESRSWVRSGDLWPSISTVRHSIVQTEPVRCKLDDRMAQQRHDSLQHSNAMIEWPIIMAAMRWSNNTLMVQESSD